MIKMMIMKKQLLYFDMDNVLVNFQRGIDSTPPEVLAQYADDGLTHTNVCAQTFNMFRINSKHKKK